MPSPRVVLLTFGGRRDRMALLKRYAEAAIDRGLIDDWHVWNFARTAEDDAWLRRSFPAVRHTGDDLRYHVVAHAMMAPAPLSVVNFDVRCGGNAHLALLPRGGGTSYEIVLGGWGNSASAMRVWPPGSVPDHASKPLASPDLISATPAVLSARAWRSARIQVARRDGLLSILVKVEGREVLSFTDLDPTPAAFDVAVMTGYGDEADWCFAVDAGATAGLFHATPERRFHGWNPVYHHYAAHAADYEDTVFLKSDDDIVFFDLARLAAFIAFRRARPEYFLLSANVVNNGVCGHVQQSLGLVPPRLMTLEMPPAGFRGSLWESGTKAEALHRWFLSAPGRFRLTDEQVFVPPARFSINFVAWLGADLPNFAARFEDDEADLTTTVPRFLGRTNAVYLPFTAAHLSFRPQDPEMNVPAVIDGYRALATAILGLPTHGRREEERESEAVQQRIGKDKEAVLF